MFVLCRLKPALSCIQRDWSDQGCADMSDQIFSLKQRSTESELRIVASFIKLVVKVQWKYLFSSHTSRFFYYVSTHLLTGIIATVICSHTSIFHDWTHKIDTKVLVIFASCCIYLLNPSPQTNVTMYKSGVLSVCLIFSTGNF